MVFVPATNTVEVFIEHQFNGKPGVGWVVHYDSSIVPWTSAMLADLGNAIVNWWNTEMKPQMNTSVSLQRVRMRDLTTQNGLVLDYSTGLPIVGTLSGSPPSANVAFSIKKNTGFSGKSFRGRVYQFGFTEADIDENFLLAVRANAYVDAWTEALFLSGAVAEYGMVLVSKFSNDEPRALAVVTPVATMSYEDLRVDTRRDRL